MDHFIEHIVIRNFKSIRYLEVNGFERINLFIGKPNVGKSNMLEALSLFCLPYMWEGSKILTDVIRLENHREFFYDGNISEGTAIGFKRADGSREECHITFNRDTGGAIIRIMEHRVHDKYSSTKSRHSFTTDIKFRVKNVSKEKLASNKDSVKKYSFSTSSTQFKETKYIFLQPPFGSNLLHVLELMPDLRKLYAQWFRQYGLRLVLDTASHSVKIQKEKGDDEVFQLPYSSVADTLQRIIFYKTAVASNQNSVLLFEEPEAHAYPPYIAEFTQEVIRSDTNQFFIVTHSPLIVEQFLSGALDDLGIFMVDFEDGQTVVKGLSTEEIKEVYRYGIDLFFNGESYTA